MTDWTTFAAATVVLTLLLLFLTHRSQQALERVRIVDERTEPVDRRSSGVDEVTDRRHTAPTGAPRDDGDGSGADEAVSSDDRPSPAAVTPTEPEEASRSTTSADAGGPRLSPGAETTEPPVGEAQSPPARELTLSTKLLLANVTLSQTLGLAVLVAVAWWTGVPAAAFGLGGDTFAVVLGWGVVAGGVLYLGNELAAGLGKRVGATAPERLREAMAPSDTRGWVLLLVVVLPVIAVFEELLFRGALIGAMAVGFEVDPWLLAVVSSVAFGLGHGAQGRLGIAVTGVLGFALAALFVHTGSLLVVIVAHYVVNALEFVVREGLGVDPTAAIG
ncbi:MAG: type II CAAX endopeptidase family protein [Halorubrum sp.]